MRRGAIGTFWLPVGLFVAALGVVGALVVQHLVDEHRHAPEYAAAPTHAYGATMEANKNGHHFCSSSDGLAPSGGDLRPWLDRDPAGGVALWLPGMNARPCRAVLTTLTRSQATAFAEAVDAAKARSSGIYNCPMDDASSVTVFLSYAGQRLAEVVREALLGCGGISAPGRSGIDGGGLTDLGPQPKGLHDLGLGGS